MRYWAGVCGGLGDREGYEGVSTHIDLLQKYIGEVHAICTACPGP
jgi:hypothetical protein